MKIYAEHFQDFCVFCFLIRKAKLRILCLNLILKYHIYVCVCVCVWGGWVGVGVSVCVYKSYYPIKQNGAQPVGHITKVHNN